MAGYVWKHNDGHPNVDSLSRILFSDCWIPDDCLKRIWSASVLQSSEPEEYLSSHQVYPARDLNRMLSVN
ncbi:MAG TPA: hypothetical protein D7H94_04660 [Candidatus Poseidoniales archaeon]|nr:MAG TPA: hypothetical protein D7H94_04660 [Candidatus Poseidoniales archaeon]